MDGPFTHTHLDTSPGQDPPASGPRPGPLPDPYAYIVLEQALDPLSERRIWSAHSQRDEDKLKKLVVEFLKEKPSCLGNKETRGARYAIDLSSFKGWPAAAIVTMLPARLPDPYSDIELVDFIGLGGMGQVWMAFSHEHLDTPLAVKFLTILSERPSPEEIAQFREEAKAGMEIQHQYVVPTLRFLDLHEHYWDCWPPAALVMHFYQPSLQQVMRSLKDQRLPQEQAIDFSRHLLDGLEALHKHGWVHRDIKPSNILLRRPDIPGKERRPRPYYGNNPRAELGGAVAQLSDLGVISRIGQPARALGQDGWKAPELFDPPGSKNPNSAHLPDPSEDMYSFGLVLKSLAEVVEGSPEWLRRVAGLLTDTDPSQRPRAYKSLWYELSPHWYIQDLMIGGGWKPEDHPYFTGRKAVFDAFEAFRQQCQREGHGGVFLVVGDAGIGKTALIAQWVGGKGGPHPAFFFREQEGRTRWSAMPETLFNALGRRYGAERPLPDKEDLFADALYDLVKHVAQVKLQGEAELLLFVDGIDEADDPQRAVQSIPKSALPKGVFVIASSRPRIGERDHLAPLRSAGAKVFELPKDDPKHMDDLESYIEQRLSDLLAKGQARSLAEDTGGIYQLVVYLIEAVERKQMSVSEALQAAKGLAKFPVAERVLAWYHIQWQKITKGLSLEERTRLTDFLRLLAAAFGPMGESQAMKILGWDIDHFDWALERLIWLLSSKPENHDGYEETYFRLRHQSVKDFLLSRHSTYRGPCRDGLDKAHARIGLHYLQQAKESGWSRVEPYGLSFVVRHLTQANDAGLLGQAAQCLTSFDYLQAAVGATAS